jgi:RimJ/RimL family protein N-acetyltransferase
MLTLIPFMTDHFAILTSWFFSEADVVQWAGPAVSYPLTDRCLKAMLDEGLSSPPTRLCWMAESSGDLVGHVQLGFDWRNGNALLSRVAINPKSRGRGLAAPMVELALRAAFEFETVHRVELNVYSWNHPAIRTYLKLGFKEEGARRSSALVGEARWDTTIMGLLRDEWEGLLAGTIRQAAGT